MVVILYSLEFYKLILFFSFNQLLNKKKEIYYLTDIPIVVNRSF